MKDDFTYKVLWVDDEKDIVESTKQDADEYGIVLDHYFNWQDAEEALNNKFEEYSAIILDAFCSFKRSSGTDEIFISLVLPNLLKIFETKKSYIPWYILSAGTMEYFSQTIKIAKEHHQSSDWGQVLYLKHVQDNDPNNSSILYKNIIKVAQNRSNNIVLYRHKETFSYLKDGYFAHEEARKRMFKMLSALYFPEESYNYNIEGNPLRKVVEFLFHGAKKRGLLPDECFHRNGSANMKYAKLFMDGEDVRYDKSNKYKVVRWGEEGESIFPEMISKIIDNILAFTHEDSHADITEKWHLEEEKKEIFFGFVLQMCHVIRWYGKFVDEHPNFGDNLKKIKRFDNSSIGKNNSSNISRSIPSKESLRGITYLVTSENGNLCCGSCKLDKSISAKVGQTVVIGELTENEQEDKKKYPFIITSIIQG